MGIYGIPLAFFLYRQISRRDSIVDAGKVGLVAIN